MKGMFGAHPGLNEPSLDWEKFRDGWDAWSSRWFTMVEQPDGKEAFDKTMAIAFACAEGNLPMVRKLHEEDGAPLDMGYMWGITLLDFAAGKSHMRIMRYLLERDYAKTVVNKASFRERITATDRACKAGFVDALDLLHEFGADIECKRLNLQVPAHGAAVWGHTPVLQRLHELGADVLTPVDDIGKAPLDCAHPHPSASQPLCLSRPLKSQPC